MKLKSLNFFSRAALLLLTMMLTTATAWAENITTHITYAGLTADDVTFTLSGNGTTFELKDGETKSVGDISGFVNFSITCSSDLTISSVSYSGTSGFGDNVSMPTNSNKGCSFTWLPFYYDLTLNISVSYSFTGYTVHFDPNGGGSGTMSDQAIATGVATALSPCTFTGDFGISFLAWNTSADGSGTAYADQQSVTDLAATGQTVTLYALWGDGFFVHFEANGGTGTMSNQFINATNYGTLNANTFIRTGYVFAGWNTKADGSGTSYTDGQSVYNSVGRGQTLTLYAQWEAYYTVHFNANGGSGTMADQTIASGQSQALSANAFTRNGYYFAGWNTQADGTGTTYNDGQSVTDLAAANATFNLYAQWKEPVTADYVDASGDAHTLTDCKEITPDHMPTTLAGNYIVSESVTYTSKVTLSGNTTIILANGKTMSIGTEAVPLGGDYALYASGTNSLTIYGQSLNAATAGSLEVYSTGYAAVNLSNGSYAQHSGNVVVNRSGGDYTNNNALNAGGSITINGGTIEATISSEMSTAIDASGNITISGGSVTATATGADSYGMKATGNVTLSWTRATDRITASSYQSAKGTISLSKRFAFDDGGTVTQATTDNMGGETLRPAALVTFNANGGSDVAAQTLFIGSAATAPTPTRTGYDLSGWTLGNADYDFATLVTEDITLTAQWSPDPAHFSQSGDTYTIHTATGWGVFCDALQDNTTYNRFSGKTVKLGANIEVSRMAGSQGHDFCGTFDGDGKTLTFNYGTSGSYASDEYAAPFHYVSTITTNSVEAPADFRNLHVAGDIYTSAKYAAGLIAQHWGTVNVENCVVSTDIHSSVSGDGTHGGFEAMNLGVLNITGCVFDGKLLTTNGTTNCGGFVGWHYGGTTNITNSLYAPAALEEGETEVGPGVTGQHPSATFGRDAVNSITNSYYTRTLGTEQGKAPLSVTGGDNVTVEVVSPVGSPVENGTYSVSGITAYARGITRGGTFYYGSGDDVSLTLSHADRTGYDFSGYEASAGTLSGSENPYTLTMPDEDVTITGLWEQPSVTLTIGSSGWTTWYDNKSYTLGAGAQAYYVSGIGNGVVNLTAIGGVPSDLPVLIHGSGTVTLTAGATEVKVKDNDEQFKGTATEISATDFTDFTDGPTYVLYGGKFLLVEGNGGIGAHKCWLTLSGSNARQLNISIGETGLSPCPSPEGKGSGCAWYDLQGRKLGSEPTRKGLYIYKGEKVKR